MSKDAAKGLADILQAISNIEIHLQGKREFIDDAQLWNIIVNHLPKLKIDAENLLRKENES